MNRKKEAFVFFDIDGTLYSPRLGIPDSTVEALNLLKRNGHHPVICTGRTKAMLLPKFLEPGFDGILAGAGAYGEWKDELIFSDDLPPEEADELMRNFSRFGFHPYAEGTRYLYYDPEVLDDPESEARRIFSLQNPAILKAFRGGHDDITKVSAIFTEKSDPEGFLNSLNEDYQSVNHYNILLETFRKNSTKGTAIRRLMQHIGKDMELTYAFGDSFNDLPMLETVKYGVCMENGDPRLLARIPLHARRLEEDGIYHSLKEFGLI